MSFHLQSSHSPDPNRGAQSLEDLHSLEDVTPRPTREAIEIEVAWGDCVLSVNHLRPPRDYWVGASEKRADGALVDFILPGEPWEGAERLIAIREGRVFVRLPSGAQGSVREHAGEPRSIDALREAPLLLGHPELELTDSVEIALDMSGLRFRIRSVELPQQLPRALGFDLDALSYLGLTALSAGGLLTSLAYFIPPLGLTDETSIDKNRRLDLAHYLAAAAEREKREVSSPEPGPKADDGGKQGSGSPGEAGAIGEPTAPQQRARVAVKGPPDNPDPHLARMKVLAEIRDTGMIGILRADAGDPNAKASPFGRDTSLGLEAMSAEGEMWGDTIADAFGNGGLGLSGIGEGGGIRGVGIGLHEVGSIGGGKGDIPGGGFGTHHGRLQDGHGARVPRIRRGATEVHGRIPPEVVQRIVRQSHGRFRMCYEQGLQRNPSLTGRVTARFMIGRNGQVISTTNGGSDLPDSGVTSCVLEAFYGLSFPAPDGGNVEVTYPILFMPE